MCVNGIVVAVTRTGAKGPPSIVVLRALGLGDLLTGVPAMRGLRRAHPEARIALATPEPLRELALSTGAVDDVVATPGLGCLTFAGRPELAVNLHGRGPESITDLRRLRPAKVLTHAHRQFAEVAGPGWQQDCHEVDRWCRMLAWFDIPCDPEDLHIDSPAAATAGAGAVVIHPGASAMSRRWPAHRYATVAAEVRRQGHDVVITGDRSERELADFVATRAGLPPSANLAGGLSVIQLFAVIDHAQLLICGDTGVAHIATATRTPSVLLFGPTPPSQWGPRTQGPHQVLWTGTPGDPHDGRPDAGLLAIGTSDVLAATGNALRSCV